MLTNLKWMISLFGILLVAIVSGCTKSAPANSSAISTPIINTPFQPVAWTATPAPTSTPIPTPSPTPQPNSLWLDPALPESLRSQIDLPTDFGYASSQHDATVRIEISTSNPISQWVYALVVPFPTVMDDVDSLDLLAIWQGETKQPLGGMPLLMSEATLGALSALWGVPDPGAVRVMQAQKLSQQAWDTRPSWAIIPFENLNPQWKVLAIDGISPIHKDFDFSDYELIAPISLIGDFPTLANIASTNRDPEKLTTLVMTGVTALVRATAYTMELRGITYPGQDIGPWLRSADITHISNEVPFAKDCPFPDPVQDDVKFCSARSYIELLEDVGTDIVELTGDHFSDWGSEAMYYTLELYDQHGWPYYGGGATLEEGRKAITIEHNGNRLAFIGCNAKGGSFAQASASSPGAVGCDFDWMQSEIQRLRGSGYIPIATFQHFEYYTYDAQPNQRRDADLLTQAGAAIVSGSQAHHPQGFEISSDSFVHHGLGNLFFDQYNYSVGTEQAFIDRHVFYDGRHISTELLSMLFVDYARARPMTAEERAALLEAVFAASGW